jgi:hypothetical protein
MNQDNHSKGRWNHMDNYIKLSYAIVPVVVVIIISRWDSFFTITPITQLSI